MLDGGLSRVPQPVDRRTARRPESPRRQPDDQPNTDVEPRPIHNSDSTRPQSRQAKPNKPPKKFNKGLAIVLALALVGTLAWLVWTSLFAGVASTVDSSKNQAVLLVNGQTYFGKLEIIDDNYLKLSDVFYVRSDESTSNDEDNEAATNTGMQLVKRGQEVFGPQDPMVINRDQVVYFENIKDDSNVSQLMKDYKANN